MNKENLDGYLASRVLLLYSLKECFLQKKHQTTHFIHVEAEFVDWVINHKIGGLRTA